MATTLLPPASAPASAAPTMKACKGGTAAQVQQAAKSGQTSPTGAATPGAVDQFDCADSVKPEKKRRLGITLSEEDLNELNAFAENLLAPGERRQRETEKRLALEDRKPVVKMAEKYLIQFSNGWKGVAMSKSDLQKVAEGAADFVRDLYLAQKGDKSPWVNTVEISPRGMKDILPDWDTTWGARDLKTLSLDDTKKLTVKVASYPTAWPLPGAELIKKSWEEGEHLGSETLKSRWPLLNPSSPLRETIRTAVAANAAQIHKDLAFIQQQLPAFRADLAGLRRSATGSGQPSSALATSTTGDLESAKRETIEYIKANTNPRVVSVHDSQETLQQEAIRLVNGVDDVEKLNRFLKAWDAAAMDPELQDAAATAPLAAPPQANRKRETHIEYNGLVVGYVGNDKEINVQSYLELIGREMGRFNVEPSGSQTRDESTIRVKVNGVVIGAGFLIDRVDVNAQHSIALADTARERKVLPSASMEKALAELR